MRKYMIFLFFLFGFIPMTVFAEDNTICEQVNTSEEKTIEISVIQELKNAEDIKEEDISKFKFNYKILDLENNVLDETTNDEDGNVTFHCFTVQTTDVGDYKVYKIIMEANDEIPFEHDPYIIYFSLIKDTTEPLGYRVAYYKDDGDDSPERYGATYKGEVFHATEEELQGQAYAELDNDTGVLTIFRDVENKYTNNQQIDNKTYYTGFETSTLGWAYNTTIRKIVIRDAVRPLYISDWFYYLSNLEEADISKLDTSLVTSFRGFFYNCPKLKNLDISTLDVSNATSFGLSLSKSGITYLDFTRWNFNPNATSIDIGDFVNTDTDLKYLNISNFGDWSTSAEFAILPCLEKIVMNDTYNFFRAGNMSYNSPDFWYNPVKNEGYTVRQIKDNLYYHTVSMEGYYIRPVCTTEASFISHYIKPEEPEESPEEEIIEEPTNNPKTTDSILLLKVFYVVCIGTWIYAYCKLKHRLGK